MYVGRYVCMSVLCVCVCVYVSMYKLCMYLCMYVRNSSAQAVIRQLIVV